MLNFLLKKDILILLKRIVITNVAFIAILFIANTFIDFEEIHKRLSISKILEYQTTAIIVIFIIETLILTVIISRWSYSRHLNAATMEILLKAGENENVEFKASLRWDYKEKKVNKELECVIAETIAGFMNTKGGTLLIGVNDEKIPLGLEMDYSTLHKENSDGFLIHLTQILNNFIGKEFSSFWSANIIRIKDKDICRINILPTNKPVYVKCNNQEKFLVRISATTQPMQIKEAYEYIRMHWKNN